MKVIITGDRNWKDKQSISTILALAHSASKRRGEPLTLIHGDAKGADSIAAEYASLSETINVIAYPADWENKGRAAGPIRNSEMIKEKPDMVFGFHNDIESSKGTRDMLRKAKKTGIPTFLISTEF